MALFIAASAVAVERLVNKRRLRLHEVLADVGWLTLIFASIEFSYLFLVESGTLLYGSAMRPLWYAEWAVFKNLMFEAAAGVFLILTSVWLESAGLHVELRRPRMRRAAHVIAVKHGVQPQLGQAAQKKCDVEWREAS